MGAKVSSGLDVATAAASDDELKALFAGISRAQCARLLATLKQQEFAGMACPDMKMSDDRAMPQMAFGLYNVSRDDTRAVVKAALAAGYRHFDSASFYNNEAEAGAELKEWLASGHERAELYITTKVWTTDLTDPAAAYRSASISVDELGLGYVDMLMVHWPTPGTHVACYQALEALVKEGKTKALGISNYAPEDYEELISKITVAPTMNTFEVNPLLYRKEWIEYFQSKGVVMQAYKPMQRGGPVLADEVVTSIAAKYSKSPAQVCIRWVLQKGMAVITKSVNPERMVENLAVYDFELTAPEIAALDALTTEEAVTTARGHYEKRKNGTPAPWGEGPRPEKREL